MAPADITGVASLLLEQWAKAANGLFDDEGRDTLATAVVRKFMRRRLDDAPPSEPGALQLWLRLPEDEKAAALDQTFHDKVYHRPFRFAAAKTSANPRTDEEATYFYACARASHLFFLEDPRNDGFPGEVREAVTCPGRNLTWHNWPTLGKRPLVCLGEAGGDPNHFQVFRNEQECQKAGFVPQRGSFLFYRDWSEYLRQTGQ